MENTEKDVLESFLSYLPEKAAAALIQCGGSLDGFTEVRFRLGAPLAVCFGPKIRCVGEKGLTDPGKGLLIGERELREGWQKVTASSVYALEEELRRGYITLKGGHRVGIAGSAVLQNGRVKTQKEIRSLNYRFSRELKDIGLPLLPGLFDRDGFQNTLLFSSPGAGKTTLLRDLTRLLSGGNRYSPPCNVALVDERGEIAGVEQGQACCDVGPFTDVLSGFPKSEGMILALRSLSPQILVTDEIGTEEDRRAVADAVRSGVKLLLTAHGGTLEELLHRPVLRSLLADGVFCRLVRLSSEPRPGTVAAIYVQRKKEGGFDYVETHSVSGDRIGTGHRWCDPVQRSETAQR
ncbi:MAG: stage III sporulation protein AA [Clostridia bacterium]